MNKQAIKNWKSGAKIRNRGLEFKFSEPSVLPCECCGKSNSPRHYPCIEGRRGEHGSMIACWEYFDSIWAGEC